MSRARDLVVRQEVAEAEEARRTAMLAGDAGTLSRLLDPAGWYCHGTGERQPNPHWIELVADGTYRFQAIEVRDQEILVRRQTAVVLSTTSFEVTVADQLVTTRRQATNVWTRSRAGWRLFLYSGVMLGHGRPGELAAEIATVARLQATEE